MLAFDPKADPPNPDDEFEFWLVDPKPDDCVLEPKADEPKGFPVVVVDAVDPKAPDPNPLDPEFWLVEPKGDDVWFENADDPNAPPDDVDVLLNGLGLLWFDPNALVPLDGDENGFALFWLVDPIAPKDEPKVGWLEPNNEFEELPPPEDANNLLLNCWPGFVKKLNKVKIRESINI